MDYALLSAPGAPLKKALLDAGVGKDISGSYDNGVYQPIFSVISKNANVEQKEEFVRVIEDTLKDIVKNGINKKALRAGINYHEFRFREADFGNYPRGLMYGLQLFDSWLYDETKPFIHMQAIPTFEFLKEQVETGYFEELIQKYLLDNTHGSIVIIKPERGRTARMDKELADKLQAYKDSLSKEEIDALVKATKELEEYQEEESAPEDLAKIPVLGREDISREIAPIYNKELETGGVKLDTQRFCLTCPVFRKRNFQISAFCRVCLELLIQRIMNTVNCLMRSMYTQEESELLWSFTQT